MKEIWKPVKGYEGFYEVSDHGNVKSLRKNKILKQTVGVKNGYSYVGLYKEGKDKRVLVHRIVATAFIDNPMQKRTVNHKDGNKSNNCVENLEWATYSENHRHAFKNGLKIVSDKQRKVASETGKKTCDANRRRTPVVMIKDDVYIKTFTSAHEAARSVGGNPSAIIAVCKGKWQSHKGYRWEYAY